MKFEKIVRGVVLAGFLILGACKSEPGLGKLSNDPIVATIYDMEEDFSQRSTFAIVDTVAISDNDEKSKLNSSDATKLINAVRQNMHNRGYYELTQDLDPDLLISIVLLKNTSISTIYYPGSWWGWYGGYYPYYPWWGGGYYPGYAYSYSYETGVQIIEMFDRRALPPSPSQPDAVKLIWSSYSGGILNNKPVSDAVQSIHQSFKQFSYITR
ncbi:MAG: DUF4136 domain-containing protein [Cytophagaceae bacterium]